MRVVWDWEGGAGMTEGRRVEEREGVRLRERAWLRELEGVATVGVADVGVAWFWVWIWVSCWRIWPRRRFCMFY